MPTLDATPATLQAKLDAANPGDVLALRSGEYPGEFNLRCPGLVLLPGAGETPVFVGPAKYVAGDKPAWIHVWPQARGVALRNLTLLRDGDIAKLYQIGWNDYGVIVEAPDVTVDRCHMAGMAKAVHIKGKTSTKGTITHNHFGPTIDSNMAIGSSLGVIRAMLIAYNVFDGSYREDGIQFMPAPNVDKSTDISNLGAIILQNIFRNLNENGIDLKAAALIVIDGNEFEHIAGSNNGAPNWNYNSVWTISLGSGCTSGPPVAIRNNHFHYTCTGIRLDGPWVIYHNLIENNNWRPEIDDHVGYGIRQVGRTEGTAVKNNLVRGNKAGDLVLTGADAAGNRTGPGPGAPLTFTTRAGAGRRVPLKQADYFSAWWGRKDLPPEIIFIGTRQANVTAVDYATNEIVVDRDLEWVAVEPVTLGVLAPQAGPIAVTEPDPPVEPPIVVDPPVDPKLTTVRLTISAEMTHAEAAELRALLADRPYTVTLGPGPEEAS